MVLQFPPADDQPVDRPAASKLKYKVVVGVGGLAGLFGIGSTLAANISLNNGGAVEFGQGVAQTAACDDDGFKVTPITHYDNSSSTFRLSKVQVSGLNLTPVGWDTGTDALSTDTAGVAANPGKYYDNGQWKKTCDGVVLDFKAYASDLNYAAYTTDGYDTPSTTITSPIGWAEGINPDGTWSWSLTPAVAVVFKHTESSNSAWQSGTESSNYAVAISPSDYDPLQAEPRNLLNKESATASFDLLYYVGTYRNYGANAAAISKITVQSMKYFPTNYANYDSYSDGRSAPILGVN